MGKGWINLSLLLGATHFLPQTSTLSRRSQWAHQMVITRLGKLLLLCGWRGCKSQDLHVTNAAMYDCRVMPQITSITLPTLLSPCWKCCGGQMTPKMTPDTRFCSPLQPHRNLALHMLKIVSLSDKLLKTTFLGRKKRCYSDTVSQVPSRRTEYSMFMWGPSFMTWSCGTSPIPLESSLWRRAMPKA